MNRIAFLTILTALLFVSGPASADDTHEGGELLAAEPAESLVAPNNGRILTELTPHAELFVNEDRKIQITFFMEEGADASVDAAAIQAYCGDRTAPTRMSFAGESGVFLSDKPLPRGGIIPTVLQFKMTPDGEKTTVRLNINLAECPGCELPEYACTCNHGDDGEHGDDDPKGAEKDHEAYNH